MARRSDEPSPSRRRRRRVSAGLALPLSLLLGVPVAAATPLSLEMPHFKFEQQAQEHCPGDSIVWAIARLGIYDSTAERWYGQTSDGAYVCRHDAETAGYRAASTPR